MAALSEHGGTDRRELESLGLDESDVLDLSVNVNPLPWSSEIRAAFRSWDPRSYPDRTSLLARRALAERFAVAGAQVVLGNGATELLWTLLDAIRPTAVTVIEPAFSELRTAALAKQIPCTQHRTDVLSDFSFPAIDSFAPDTVVYFAHPGNPLGAPADLERVETWARRNPRTLFVADESFLNLSEDFDDLDRVLPSNVLRLRSLTKDFGLAGVRVGYMLAPASIVEAMETVRPPWTVNALAQKLVLASLRSSDWLARARNELCAARRQLVAKLDSAGFETLPSTTIYCMVRVGEGSRCKRFLLREHRIRVRDCASFGMPGWIRVAARESQTHHRLLEALNDARRSSV